MTRSEFRGGKAKPIDDLEFPPVGKTDFDVFENNLLEVMQMQFVFNHTTFDPEDEIDQGVLAAYKRSRRSFCRCMSVVSGVWLYQLTDDGLALELTAKGRKYFKDNKLN